MFPVTLSSVQGQRIALGDRGSIQIVAVDKDGVVLGISVPKDCMVVRRECFVRLGGRLPDASPSQKNNSQRKTELSEVRNVPRRIKQGMVIDNVCVTIQSVRGKAVVLKIAASEETEMDVRLHDN